MFVDYYAVLEIDISATQEEIKSAFKRQALKWHPDRNPGQDTTLRMQQINEAYLILKDPEGRTRYNREYQRFKQYQQQQDYSERERQRQHSDEQKRREKEKQQYEKQYEYKEYTVNDDILGKWMENARKQAVDLAKKTIEDFKGISTACAKAVAKEVVAGIGRYLIVSVLIMIIFAIVKSCNG
jgi:curved DNA-binding protein CbpA